MADSFTGTLTGGLIDPSTPNYGKLAKRSEAARQGLIRLGLQQIGAVYGGGTAPFYTQAGATGERFNPRETYYFLNKRGQFAPYWAPGRTAARSQFSPGIGTYTFRTAPGSPWLGADIFGEKKSPRDIARQQYSRGQLFNAPTTRSFEGFQPEFFEKRAQAYVNYALPQVAEQYRGARNALVYGLSNRGLQQSSQATTGRENLERTAGTARQNVADTGLAQADQLRRDIEQARQQNIQQLYQSADPARAFQSAISTAAGFQRPSAFPPVANMFANLANQYYINQVLNSYKQAPYGNTPYSLAGLLAPTGSSTY